MGKELARKGVNAFESVFSVVNSHLFVSLALWPRAHWYSYDCFRYVREAGFFEVSLLPGIDFSNQIIERCNQSDPDANVAVLVRQIINSQLRHVNLFSKLRRSFVDQVYLQDESTFVSGRAP